MSARGMIMQERKEEVLASAMLEVFARQPRATWKTVEQLADACEASADTFLLSLAGVGHDDELDEEQLLELQSHIGSGKLVG